MTFPFVKSAKSGELCAADFILRHSKSNLKKQNKKNLLFVVVVVIVVVVCVLLLFPLYGYRGRIY